MVASIVLYSIRHETLNLITYSDFILVAERPLASQELLFSMEVVKITDITTQIIEIRTYNECM